MLALLLAAAAAPAPTPPSLVNMAEIYSSADYPSAALRAGIEGTTEMSIRVDAKGKPIGCTIKTSSGTPALDSTSCKLMLEKGKFTPARDARGRAIAGQISKRVMWRLPAEEPDADLEYFSIRLVYPLQGGNPLGACRGDVTPGGGGAELCEETRSTAQQLATAIPAKDRAGVNELVMTIERRADTLTGPAPLAGIPGLVIIDDRFARLTVDASGKVINCVAGGATLASSGGASVFCGRFEATRYATDPAAPAAERKILFRSQAYARK